MTNPLLDMPRRRAAGGTPGIASICTAHPLVIEAALLRASAQEQHVLIEATCNQVNQDGGYTGMTPADFRAFVEAIANRVGFDRSRLILGGDHLGPNPWKHLPADAAMAKAEIMIAAYSAAGFGKLHLDTSMGCAGEPAALSDIQVARRAARLAVAAERSSGSEQPVYVIGTEVPVPGGALEVLDHLRPTLPEAVGQTVEEHCNAFAEAGVDAAFERALAVVVQPGVEFGNEDVAVYRPESARDLSVTLSRMPQFVFEAHSTDYQPESALRALVDDGFAILKVGPWLTFALREALYGLDQIAGLLNPAGAGDGLMAAMERLMLREPGHWHKYYPGDEATQRVQRHFSYSDRIRYYWPHVEARAAVQRSLSALADRAIPLPLVSQYLGTLYPMVAEGHVPAQARPLLMAAVSRVLDIYDNACRSGPMR